MSLTVGEMKRLGDSGTFEHPFSGDNIARIKADGRVPTLFDMLDRPEEAL